LHGHAPFTGQFAAIKDKILGGKIRFKKNLPKDCRNLIQSLLQREPNDRIPLVKVFDHKWVLRLQDKHNLIHFNSKPPKKSKKRMPKEEQKGDPMNDDDEEDNMFKENSPNKQKYQQQENYKENLEFEEHKQSHRKKKEHRKHNKNKEKSAVELEKSLREIEKSQAQRQKLLEEQPQKRNFDGLLRPKNNKNANNDNLLDLSTFEDHVNESPLNQKFEKLQKIESKKVDENRESTLPNADDFDDAFINKNNSPNYKNQSKTPRINKDDEPMSNFKKKGPTRNKSFLLQKNDHEENNILNELGKSMMDNSYLGVGDFDGSPNPRNKKNDEMLNFLNGMENQLEDIEVSGEKLRAKPKIIDPEFDKNHYQKKHKNDAPEQILEVIDQYGNDEDYKNKIDMANQILDNDDTLSSDSSEYQRKSIDGKRENSEPNHLVDKEPLNYNVPDEEMSDHEPDDKIAFLQMEKVSLKLYTE